MAVEGKRGCGYRKKGGIYLVSDPLAVGCDRMPIPLTICTTCGQGIKQSRGWTWIDPENFLKGDHEIFAKRNWPMKDRVIPCPEDHCYVCRPAIIRHKEFNSALLWIGSRHYSPASFMNEAAKMGVSKRISQVPHDFEVSKTVIFIAHPHAMCTTEDLNRNGKVKRGVNKPGIITAFMAKRIEKLYPESHRSMYQERLDALPAWREMNHGKKDEEYWRLDVLRDEVKTLHRDITKRGLTPIYVPDDDPDHDPSKGKDDDE